MSGRQVNGVGFRFSAFNIINGILQPFPWVALAAVSRLVASVNGVHVEISGMDRPAGKSQRDETDDYVDE